MTMAHRSRPNYALMSDDGTFFPAYRLLPFKRRNSELRCRKPPQEHVDDGKFTGKDFQAKKDRYPDGGRADHNDHWPFLRRNNPFDSVWNACTIDRTLGHGSRYAGTSGCRVESFADELVWRKFRQRRN